MYCREVGDWAYKLGDEVYIQSVERRGPWIYAVCYVKSQTKADVCYQVVLKLRRGRRYFVGRCECPDFKYRGGPCKHVVRAKVALREFLKIQKAVRR